MINDNLNPYDKNLSTVFKTLSKTVKGNATAESALQLLKEHVNRKTPKSRVETAKTYGIKPTDIVTQSADYVAGEKTPRSVNILQMVEGIGGTGRSVEIVKKELGICEANLDYLRKWKYVNITSSEGVA
jgi:hypothetical protein|tara:strand:+ start:206 stop:592 length:387 start_codon:yes stop_codon:yes gene_type:complete